MAPAPGERLVRFVGDRVHFTLHNAHGGPWPEGWRAFLRTNLGRAGILRREIIQAHTQSLPLGGAAWRDIPMQSEADGWSLEIPLAEAGYFKAKAYAADPRGWQHWPAGPDAGIAVHPDHCRTANTIYCAFPRMFGPTRDARSTAEDAAAKQLQALDKNDYAVIPPSGKLRDLLPQLPHIINTLGCRILHLLPVSPTPTTYARFGRFGSPYASLDLTAIDPALIVFDKRSTGVEQFCELAYATHRLGARVFLDIVINHTGWASALQERHPEWFLRKPGGEFVSPGAWGVIWEDLVELKNDNVELWDELAEVFLTWCRRGVDGFRCDAGYMVPLPAWQFIIARVQQEFPETVFLLEGLGGAWEVTEGLLADGGMQWAYSELFQNYSGPQVAQYLDHSFRQSHRAGLLVHYSETHDNDRLAAKGRAWSLLRNRLCALASQSGGFGFTCGVEWLATERINVHSSRGLAWGDAENIVLELGRLNHLLAGHPCFFDGARLTRLSHNDSPVLALRRESEEGQDRVLVLVNTDAEREQYFALDERLVSEMGELKYELLGQPLPKSQASGSGGILFTLAPAAGHCLAPSPEPLGLAGEAYRRARAQAAWALKALSQVLPLEQFEGLDWRWLAEEVERSGEHFLAAASAFADAREAGVPEAEKSGLQTLRHEDLPFSARLAKAIQQAVAGETFSKFVVWQLPDRRRVTLVPPGHWLVVRDTAPFRATLDANDGTIPQHTASITVRDGHIAYFAPQEAAADAALSLERYADADARVTAAIRLLAPDPSLTLTDHVPHATDVVLLTNGRGGMARFCVDLGRVLSKYDCILGANLHPSLPVDRHVFVKRIRVWVNADGFISPLDATCLARFAPGPPAVWHFVANAGDARTVEIQLTANMLQEENTTVLHFSRPTAEQATGKQLPANADVRLTVRFDLEDRNFHWETKRNGGAEHHFAAHIQALTDKCGFAFTPASDRRLRVYAAAHIFAAQGASPAASDQALEAARAYHPQPEWCENIPHPVEQSRGQTASGDAYSPGWFDLALPKGSSVSLVVTAEEKDPALIEVVSSAQRAPQSKSRNAPAESDVFGQQLRRAARAFVVRRGTGATVIAGYPWFLDWGRDSLICARGLLAGGMVEEVRELLLTFARFEDRGTLPNTIHGENASNRDTSDAPLWFAVACEELAGNRSPKSEVRSLNEARNPKPEPATPGDSARASDARLQWFSTSVNDAGRTVADVLRSIAVHHINGTPNGIRIDPESALIWSPSHFTWMDTNYPAGTPREGYPIEIQALWIRLLRLVQRLDGKKGQENWGALADRAEASLQQLFWREERGWFADVLHARHGQPAREAVVDDALRSNCLLAISLGTLGGERARRCVEAARKHLVVPGALRSLAPLPVSVPLPIHGSDGRLLNDPAAPYWGHYEGEEDTRRKPAYHNGTAWTWTFPVFCEALARVWDFSPAAVVAARAYLGSMDRLMMEGCLGQLPEIIDGDAPHTQRGCDAQAWGVTEALRVWKLLSTERA